MRFSKQSLLEIWIPFVVDVALVHLQLLRLRRFGPSAASDSDQLIVQQSKIRSEKQAGISMGEQLLIKPRMQFTKV